MVKTLLKLSCFASLLLTADMASGQTKHIVQVGDGFFNPASFTANIGDTVRWEFIPGSMENHTTTSSNIPSGAATWDELINTANPSFEYIITEDGQYDYVCTPHISMGMVASFTVMPTTSVATVNPIQASITPNPAKNTITISSHLDKVNIRLIDIQGRVVKSWKDQGRNATLDISNIPIGMYLITIQKDKLLQKEQLVVE